MGVHTQFPAQPIFGPRFTSGNGIAEIDFFPSPLPAFGVGRAAGKEAARFLPDPR
jgi:hypothetical protein